jgi:hypothetical protein
MSLFVCPITEKKNTQTMDSPKTLGDFNDAGLHFT